MNDPDRQSAEWIAYAAAALGYYLTTCFSREQRQKAAIEEADSMFLAVQELRKEQDQPPPAPPKKRGRPKGS